MDPDGVVDTTSSDDGIVTTDYETQRADDKPEESDDTVDDGTYSMVNVDGKAVTSISLLPKGHPDTWTTEQWDGFENHLETLPLDAAIELEEAAWHALGMTYGSISDLLDSRARAESGTGSSEGKAVPTVLPTKPKTQGPAKGSPCIDDCRGPGWAEPKGYVGNKHQYTSHIPRCPQHENYDPTVDYKASTGSTPSKPYVKACTHDRSKTVKLENGLEVYATANRDVKYLQDELVDIGVYAYSGWQGNMYPFVSAGLTVPWAPARTTEAIMLPWPDYKVPEDTSYMVDMIRWMIAQMEAGKHLEVACMGGHGRTGTLLAMLLVAQGLTPGEAIREARTRHCKSAVESAVQCDYIAEFYEAFHGNSEWRKTKASRKLFNRQKASGKSGGTSKSWASGSSQGSTQKPARPSDASSTWKPGYVWSTVHLCWLPATPVATTVTPITHGKGV